MKRTGATIPFKKKSPGSQPHQVLYLVTSILALVFSLLLMDLLQPRQPVFASPADPGPCTPTSEIVFYHDVNITFHYPIPGTCTGGISAPYPAIVFAHGFSMFGITNGMLQNYGNGEHLASWGYVTAIPRLPDDTETRAGIVLDIFDYFESATLDPASFLYNQIDSSRFGIAGHSLGGSTALADASRDPRIKAAVGLDPVFHTGGPFGGEIVWDPYLEGPNILVPTAILGAPADPCNSDNDSLEIYSTIGARLKAHYFLVDASHWIFSDPGNPLFYPFCGGSTDPSLTALSQKYMTAWFNFYLNKRYGDYRYIYGVSVLQDVQDGLILLDVNVYPGLVFLPMLMR